MKASVSVLPEFSTLVEAAQDKLLHEILNDANHYFVPAVA